MLGTGQGMHGRHGKHKFHHRTNLSKAQSRRHVVHEADPYGQVGLARSQRVQAAAQRFIFEAQPGRRISVIKVLAQIHHHAVVDDSVNHDGELAFPAGGHAFDTVGDAVHIVEQTQPLTDQFLAWREDRSNSSTSSVSSICRTR